MALFIILKEIEKHMKLRKVVYTVITGKYDNLRSQPRIKGWDYICFTDDPELKSEFWDICQVPADDELDSIKRQRKIKILAHEYLSEYDLSVYIDGNVRIIGDLDQFIEKNCPESKGYVFIGEHPERDCIYDEAKACIKLRKGDPKTIVNQVVAYYKEGFPKHYGLTQSCIVIRYHNNEDCKRLMESWWQEVKDKSHRDQLSLSYCEWKDGKAKITVLDKGIFDGDCFCWGVFHNQNKKKGRLAVRSNDNIFWMRFVKPGQTAWSCSRHSTVLKGKKVIDLSWLNVRYMEGYAGNEHHITTDSFYKIILPLMSVYMKNFPFDIEDFEKIEYHTPEGFDLSYLEPRNKDLRFTIECDGNVLSRHGDFATLHMMNDSQNEYHNLFRGDRTCCRILNETADNKKRLLISGDGMLIPAVPILARYYKEVIYLDNRDGKSYKDYYQDILFDDVIIQLYEDNPARKPLVDNLI